jgi:hypothetical protein
MGVRFYAHARLDRQEGGLETAIQKLRERGDVPLHQHEGDAMEQYDVGMVCLNGHEVNAACRANPEYSSKFCKECGGPTFDACPKCKAKIRGLDNEGFDMGLWTVPKHCHECGAAYPWTERKEKALATAIEELDELTDAERDTLKESIPDAIAETPKTEIAIARFKKAIIKAGVIGGKLLTDTLSKVAAEIVVKSIGIK